MHAPGVTRRRFHGLAMAAALASFWMKPSRAAEPAASSARRVIALDWGVAETLVALGHLPLGAAEVANYNRTVVTPRMPSGVVDVGLRLAPNPELMQELDPDLVLINTAQVYMEPSLKPFGRTEVVPIYTQAQNPYALSREATTMLAAQMGDPPSAVRLLARTDAVMADTRRRLRGYDGRPIYAVTFTSDGRHVIVSARGSLIHGVFGQLGLRNAWQGDSNAWGVAIAGIEALAAEPEARIVYFLPLSPQGKKTLSDNPLWLRLPCVRAGRVKALPPTWPFGALPSAMRIAHLLGQTLVPRKLEHG